jgi:C-terminal processing protease CtpA/Prc
VPLQVQAPRQSAPSDTHFQPATGEGLRIYPSVLSRLPKEFRLEAGDRVLSINGEAALSYDELWEAAAASVEGTSVELEIVLAGTDETVTVSVSR